MITLEVAYYIELRSRSLALALTLALSLSFSSPPPSRLSVELSHANMIALKINAVQFRFIKLLDHLLLPLQAQLTFLYLLRVIMLHA